MVKLGGWILVRIVVITEWVGGIGLRAGKGDWKWELDDMRGCNLQK